jgi:succinyl-CoA synthetase beta subunit
MLSRVFRGAARMGLAKPAGVRFLNLHEYQSKMLMDRYKVKNQKGDMAATPEEAYKVAEWILSENPAAELVIKAQVHAGGRGMGHFKETGFKGGVQIVTTAEDTKKMAEEMLGKTLVTKQTGEEGQQCAKVLINEGIEILEEKYFSILMDRAYGGPVIVASKEGGMDIEDVAETSPEAILKEPVDIMKGIQPEQCEKLAIELGFTGKQIGRAMEQMKNLYELFIGTDSTQVEINPFAVGGVPGFDLDQVYCVDAKLNFDDNAFYRQLEAFGMRDITMEDPRDVRAEDAGLNYIGLDGNIGCMVNGAGLAMATMDVIKLYGGEPANFLDVGGGASAEMVTEAFKILTSDPNVKAIMVNIFGGIMKCDVIAEGIITAAKEVGMPVPLIVRLEGTNVEMGKQMLADSGLDIIAADSLDDAAQKAVARV